MIVWFIFVTQILDMRLANFNIGMMDNSPADIRPMPQPDLNYEVCKPNIVGVPPNDVRFFVCDKQVCMISLI